MMAFGALWIIAISWCFLVGSFTLPNLMLGGLLGWVVFVLTAPFNGMEKSFQQLKDVFRLILFVLWELVVSSLWIAWDILTPTDYAKPRIVCIPVDDLDDIAITILANAISLTPGSLALEVSDDRHYLYVHVMYAEDREATVKSINLDLGNRVRSACGLRQIEP